MTYDRSSPLIGTATGSADGVMQWLDRQHIVEDRPFEVRGYLNELYRLAPLVGLNADILAAQAVHETDAFRSFWWRDRLNPAGIGITGDPTENKASGTWTAGRFAAQAHIAHMSAYVLGGLTAGSIPEAQQAINFDPRYKAVFEAGLSKSVAAIGDLGNGKWATDPEYSSAIVERANQIFGGTQTVTKFTTTVPGLPGGPLETTYPVALKIIPVGLQRPGAPAHMPRRSVQHGNGNPNAMAAADAQWLANGAPNDQGKPTQTSWHAIGDDTQVIVQVPLNEVTWHAADGSGPGNMNGLSCEMSEHSAIWSDQGRALRCIANCADFMGRCAARFNIAKPEQHWDFNWVECCNAPCDVQCGNRHNCPDKLRHSTIAGRPAWDIYVGDWNAAKTDELARMHGTTPTPVQPSPIWWTEGEVGPKKRASDGVVALAMLGQVKALRTVPLHKDADQKSPKVGEVKEGQNATVVGTYHGKQRWAFVKIVDGQYGRALWSAFDPRWPTL